MQQVFARFLDYGDTAPGAMMLDNAEWLDGLRYIEFLRDIGRHFSVNRMLSFESVKSRLDREQSLSFLEFNYMILQAYDFLELNRRYGCTLQMGGSDQWGNIVNGIDLTRRVAGTELFGLTSPLLATADGRKMGKSAGGAVWLNADMLSPYEFWQFWRNTLDADVGRFLKFYTELPVDECDRLGALEGSDINAAKIILANEVTTLLHGAEAAANAEATAREVFEKGGVGDDLPTLELTAGELGRGHFHRAAHRALGPCEIRQGRQAPDRRERRAPRRRPPHRYGAHDRRGRSSRTDQAFGRQEAPRADQARRLTPRLSQNLHLRPAPYINTS